MPDQRFHGVQLAANSEFVNFVIEKRLDDPAINDQLPLTYGRSWYNVATNTWKFCDRDNSGTLRVRSFLSVEDFISAISNITNQISNLNAALTNEISRAITAENTISTAVTTVGGIPVINSTTDTLLFGQPVYLVSENFVAPASAADDIKKDVVALVSDTIILPNGGVGKAVPLGKIIGPASQWSIITGTPEGLIENSNYFLSATPGLITTTPPTQDGQYCCLLGRAITATEFVVKIERPIKL